MRLLVQVMLIRVIAIKSLLEAWNPSAEPLFSTNPAMLHNHPYLVLAFITD